MKNKFKIFLLLLFTYLNTIPNLFAKDFSFNTSEIKITENGNIIDATNGEANSLDGNINIIAEKFNYNKYKLILNANTNATALFRSQNIQIKATDEAIDHLSQLGFDPQYGGRPVKRVLQREILNPLSKDLLGDSLDKNKGITVDYFEGKFVFRNG